MQFSVETERETDGRWIAEIHEIPGAMAYGATKEEAVNKAYVIAIRALADQLESSRTDPPSSIRLESKIA